MGMEMVTGGHGGCECASTGDGQDICRMLELYDLSGLRQVERLTGGSASEVWRLKSGEGEFVLHRTSGSNEAHLLFCLELVETLGRCNLSFALPRPLRSRRGHLLERMDDRHCWVTHYISGSCSQRPPTPTILAQVARGAAELHSAAAAISKPLHESSVAGPFDRWWEMGQMRKDAVDADLSEQRSAIEVFYLKHHHEPLQAIWELRPRDYSRLPTLPIHGDLRFWNLVFRGERLVGILDFGAAKLGTRVEDLASVLLDNCRESESVAAMDLGHARDFFSEYERHLPMSAHERSFIPDLVISRAVMNFWGTYRAARDGLIQAPMETLVATLEQFRWAQTHREEIAAALC